MSLVGFDRCAFLCQALQQVRPKSNRSNQVWVRCIKHTHVLSAKCTIVHTSYGGKYVVCGRDPTIAQTCSSRNQLPSWVGVARLVSQPTEAQDLVVGSQNCSVGSSACWQPITHKGWKVIAGDNASCSFNRVKRKVLDTASLTSGRGTRVQLVNSYVHHIRATIPQLASLQAKLQDQLVTGLSCFLG